MRVITDKDLMEAAEAARLRSYSPYSHFCVGAALLGESGTIYTGCNIENAAFSPTNCAERTAFFKAVSEGERSFAAIAITGGREGAAPSFCAPCGVCRQVMLEFCKGDFRVILGNSSALQVTTLAELTPYAFDAETL